MVVDGGDILAFLYCAHSEVNGGRAKCISWSLMVVVYWLSCIVLILRWTVVGRIAISWSLMAMVSWLSYIVLIPRLMVSIKQLHVFFLPDENEPWRFLTPTYTTFLKHIGWDFSTWRGFKGSLSYVALS